MRKIPMRMCIVTREKIPKKELIRVVRNEDKVLVDDTGKVNGHGVYLKKDKKVILKAKENKILDKALDTKIEDTIYEELLSKIN